MTISMTVIGAGAWGTALALAWARKGLKVTLIGRNEDVLNQISKGKHHKIGEINTPSNLQFSTDISLVKHADIVVLATPAQSFNSLAKGLSPILPEETPLVITAKGIDLETQSLLSDCLSRLLPNRPMLCLSGPSFAVDVAADLPTAVTLAAKNLDFAQNWAENLSTSKLRCYASDDLNGVQLGGALKNVLAIAAGIVEGFGLGESAKAAIITRAFVEMQRYANHFGANAQTLFGLSGLGDLILTSSSLKSRNFAYGYSLGQAAKNREALPAPQGTVEGIATTKVVYALSNKDQIDMPIAHAIYDCVHKGVDIAQSIDNLLARPVKKELDIF